MGTLEGKIILVTKATEFVGAAVCKSCLQEGAFVVAQCSTFSNKEKAASFKNRLGDLYLTTTDEPNALTEEVITKYGRIDGLVPNDGFPAIRAAVEDASPADMRNGLEAMIVEPFQLISAVVPHMKAQKSGRIVMATSAAPFHGLPNYSMYCTARGAQNAMVLTLAKELARSNIAVNGVAPNFVENPSYFSEEVLKNEAVQQKIISQIPLGRIGKAEEASDVIAFLLSEKAGFVTGHIIPTAGGWA